MQSCVREYAQDQLVEGVAQLEHCETAHTERLPQTGIVACLGAKAAGCSLLGTLLLFLGASPKSGSGPS